jgi:hypothetical protein
MRVRGSQEEDECEEAYAGPVEEMNGWRPAAVASGVPSRPKRGKQETERRRNPTLFPQSSHLHDGG